MKNHRENRTHDRKSLARFIPAASKNRERLNAAPTRKLRRLNQTKRAFRPHFG
jgi:hypothetical protein